MFRLKIHLSVYLLAKLGVLRSEYNLFSFVRAFRISAEANVLGTHLLGVTKPKKG
jgi:hypothetical protein